MSLRFGKLWALLFLLVALNFATWNYSRHMQARWANVPPAPSVFSASFSGLGDFSFSYRVIALMLQNLGDMGGRTTSLLDYNYEDLSDWFMIQHKLDPHSDFTPLLASFYFGAVSDESKLQPLVDYLRIAGASPEGEKWHQQ